MLLTEVNILGYKSIGELLLPINKIDDSYTKILIGKNESGKSNILQGMAIAKDEKDGKEVDFYSLQNQETNNEYVECYYTMTPTDTEYRTTIKDHLELPDALLEYIVVSSVTKNTYLNKDSKIYQTVWDFDVAKVDVNSFLYKDVPAGKTIISNKDDVAEEDLPNFNQLTADKLNELIKPALEDWARKNDIQVSVWKAEPGYLITNAVNTEEFINAPYKYPLLMNIFKICGYTTMTEIQEKLRTVIAILNLRRNLETELSEKTTEYLNNKWKEHSSIDIDIRIETSIAIHVKDKAKKDKFHAPANRSDGFKQFVSLLLSISADNEAGRLKNHLILLDEPEIHLHPSGIRDMLQELLKLGKNNYVFVSTHSNFMLDAQNKQRHYLVTKPDVITQIKQIENTEDLNGDEVLQAAFGINVIKDFLSPYKLLVEGASDKRLFAATIMKLRPNAGILITNGHGDSIKPEAAIMNYHDITPYVIVDDDEAGDKYKKEIKSISENYTDDNVVSIRDLNTDVVRKGTIEDTLPIDFVNGKMNEVLYNIGLPDIELVDNQPVCKQLNIHLNQHLTQLARNASKQDKDARKDRINAIIKDVKTKIAEDWNSDLDAPKLEAIIREVLRKFNLQ